MDNKLTMNTKLTYYSPFKQPQPIHYNECLNKYYSHQCNKEFVYDFVI